MTSLYNAVLEILQEPRILSEVIDELSQYKIFVYGKQGGFMGGYLEALADAGHIHILGTTSKRKIYSRYSDIEFAHRRCPYCMRVLVLYESDVGTRYTCPRCFEESTVERTFRDGVQLKKAEVVQ